MNIQCNSYVFVSIINVINFHTAIDNVFNNKQRVYFSSPTLPWPAAKRKIVNWGRNCYGCYISIHSAPTLGLQIIVETQIIVEGGQIVKNK